MKKSFAARRVARKIGGDDDEEPTAPVSAAGSTVFSDSGKCRPLDFRVARSDAYTEGQSADRNRAFICNQKAVEQGTEVVLLTKLGWTIRIRRRRR